MTQRVFGRRAFAISLAAGLATAGRTTSAIISVMPATRLMRPEDQIYVPPASLATVADIYKRMTAPIRVNSQGPFAFVVDTGANQSVISDELAAHLGLIVGAPEALNGVAGVSMAPTAVVDLGVGRQVQESVTVSILPKSSIGGLGILGLDRLEGQQLILDFHSQSLRIGAPGSLWHDGTDIFLKAQRRDGQLTLVDADLAGIPLIAFIDSGAQNTIGNLALRELAVARNSKRIWLQTPVISATGQVMSAEMADLPHLRIGGLKLPNWPVAFADLHTFKMWNLVKRPAILLGVDILSRFQSVSLDFARNEVRFRLPVVNS